MRFEQENSSGKDWRHFVSGGVAGAISRSCTAPADRLKILLQVHGSRKQTSVSNTMRYMVKEGGFTGLWRGNGINVIKVAPETAFKFLSYEKIKTVIRGDQETNLKIHERAMAGGLTGIIIQTLTYPLDVLKTRLALRKTGQLKGISTFMREMVNAEGKKVFYKGFWLNLVGAISYFGIEIPLYETLKRYYIDNFVEEKTDPSSLVIISCVVVGSSCGQLATYPLALVRTKLQSQAGLGSKLLLPREQTHAIGLFRHIWRTEGVRGLYRGLLANMGKVLPAVSIQYYVYETLLKRFGAKMTY